MKKIFFALAVIAAIVGLIGFALHTADEAQRQAEAKYLGKTIEVKDYYLDKRFFSKSIVSSRPIREANPASMAR